MELNIKTRVEIGDLMASASNIFGKPSLSDENRRTYKKKNRTSNQRSTSKNTKRQNRKPTYSFLYYMGQKEEKHFGMWQCKQNKTMKILLIKNPGAYLKYSCYC